MKRSPKLPGGHCRDLVDAGEQGKLTAVLTCRWSLATMLKIVMPGELTLAQPSFLGGGALDTSNR
jgi:hypothetical protein